ncbi:MAG: basic amino acid ABC transporter substrate-binding protein [Propionibacteriales bacterium]|nr:basic amino acid ABC transporter substrate-binding protein [Propionibacteriales bacterium]
MRISTRTTIVAGVALMLTLAGCSTEKDKTELDSGEKLIKDGTLTVCTHLPYKPFQSNKGDDVVGFDVDLMDLVAEKLGVKQQIFDTPFEGIQSGQSLNTGKCDVAAAGMTITEERQKVIDFSDPYFDATQALLVKKGSGITSLEDLDGKSLAVQEATTGALYAEDKAPEGTEIRSFEDLALLTTAVQTGQVDAGINDNGVLYDFAKSNSDVEVATEFDTGEQYGFAVEKDANAGLLDTINEVLAGAKDDGTYDKIYKKWFGSTPQVSEGN